MPRIDYSGVPTTEAPLEAPNDYQHIDASPNAFGAAAAQGAEAAGQGAVDASKFYGQVAAANGTNNFLQDRAKILYGDPTQGVAKDSSGQPVLGPGGMPVYNGGFYGLRGADAMEAAQPTMHALQESLQEHQESLSTPEAKLQYTTEARRYFAQAQSDIGQRADEQSKVWATSTYDNQVALHQNDLAQNPTDPGVITRSTDAIVGALQNKARIAGVDPSAATLQGHQLAAQTQVKALLLSDPIQANEAFQANKGLLASTPDFYSLGQEVHSRYINAQMAPAADGLINDAISSAQKLAQPGPGGAAGARPAAPLSGGAYDQIAQAATQNGATPDEVNFLKREAQLESGGNPNARNGQSHGLFQFHPDTFAHLGGTDINDTGQQTQKALQLARNNQATLTQAGVDPSGANLYLMHQQGPAGGLALLRAPPETSAVAALTPAYETNGRTPDQAAAIATRAIVGNGGKPDMTAGQFVDHWNQKWGAAPGVGASGAAAYPSTADALRATIAPTLTQARAHAEQLFPGDSQAQDQLVEKVERGLNLQISQQEQQYTVNTHIVQSALASDHPPISEDELMMQGPQVATAWRNMQVENPIAASGVERMFDANARGKADGFGSNFKDYLDRALAPTADPTRIKTPTDLYPFVGSGDGAALTNTGVGALSDLIGQRGTPQGEAFASQVKGYMDQAYGQLSFSNQASGLIDHKGDAAYEKFAAQALPIMMKAQKSGQLASVLNPKSPDYIGNVATTFQRTPAQMVRDRLSDEGVSNVLTGSLGPQTALREAVAMGKISREEGVWIAQKLGYIGGAPAAAPPSASPGGAPHPSQSRPLFTQHKDAQGRIIGEVNEQP